MTENYAKIKIERHIQFLRENWKPYPDYNVIEALRVAIRVLEEIQQYRAIDTIEEFKALKEKNEPKKQGNIDDFERHLKLSKAGFLCCSRTNKDIRYPLISLCDLEYCPRCGQKLDWKW